MTYIVQGWLGGKRQHDVWVGPQGWTWAREMAVKFKTKEEAVAFSIPRQDEWEKIVEKVTIVEIDE